MTLSTGTKLSHYEITSQLGKGGMGEVYQAKDTKLGRDVAIKVLPEEFAKDTDRVARFQREAKLLASLNHPNIAAIYGLEESDGTNFLVMELVEGQTLDERIKSGRIPVEEALKLALQIAEALEAAHEKGVIHRDLKPANIKVTPDGKVKVLDFGLAKAFAGEQADLNLSNSPTLSVAATQQGVILGTAAYMSPEQARGKEVDKRADIWAFGVVLFEMLTGKQVFTGDTVSDTLASVLAREPEWQNLSANLHPRIRLLLERCLKKDPKNRYHDIADARVDIQEVLADPSNILAQPVPSEESRTKFRTMLPWIAATLVLGSVITGIAVWSLRAPEPLKPIYIEHTLRGGQRFIGSFTILTVSPDGNQFVYTTNEGLYLKSINEPDAKLISPINDYAIEPFFSPDGNDIGYFSGVDSQLKWISTSGGAAKKICEIDTLNKASWIEGNTIIFYKDGQGIMKVSAEGGTPELLMAMEEAAYFPRLLPDGKSVLYTSISDEGLCVFVQTPESDKPKKLFKGENAYYLPTGHLAYAFENDIWVVPFDLKTLKVTGDHKKVIEGVWKWAGGSHFAVSDSGTLAYISEPPSSERILVWVDREGSEKELSAPPGAYEFPKIAPQGDKIALSISTGGLWDISIWDIIRGDFDRLTSDGASLTPFWNRNGEKIYYSSLLSGVMDIRSIEVDGSGESTLILHEPNTSLFVTSMLRDGTLICNCDNDIGTIPPGDKTGLKLLLNKKYMELNGKISPDEHWLAYESNKEGQFEVYVCSYPNVEDTNKKISMGGGHDPIWSIDGSEIFYRSEDAVMSVSVETTPKLIADQPEKLFNDRYALLGDQMTWDIHHDGDKFLMVKDYSVISGKEGTTQPRINIILNWFEELKEKGLVQ